MSTAAAVGYIGPSIPVWGTLTRAFSGRRLRRGTSPAFQKIEPSRPAPRPWRRYDVLERGLYIGTLDLTPSRAVALRDAGYTLQLIH